LREQLAGRVKYVTMGEYQKMNPIQQCVVVPLRVHIHHRVGNPMANVTP
jgi:hypothetical protein